MNIRKSEQGVQMKTSKAFTEGKNLGGNLHCIIEFEKTEKAVKKSELEGEYDKLRGDGGGKYRKFVANNYQGGNSKSN